MFGEIYRQSQGEAVSSVYAWNGESVRVDYSTTFPAGDVWTAQADHFMEVDHYLVSCSLTISGQTSCSAPFYLGTTAGLLAETVDRERVCGEQEVDEIYREYRDDGYGSNIRPECEDFTDNGGSTHFTWDELNGKHSSTTVVRGNPHLPWAMVTQGLKNGLDHIASNYANFDGIQLTSGYRCPHGNQIVGGAQKSFHTHGRAADLWRNGWTKSEFDAVATVADKLNPVERFSYDRYSDHHLHVAF